MCNDWIKELKGWCKSFTRAEIFLAILQAVLLIICIGFLVFLILHLLVCFYKPEDITFTTPFTPQHKDNEQLVIDSDDDSLPGSKINKKIATSKEETRTEKFLYIHKGISYTGLVTIPHGTGIEKIVFINKGVSSEGVVTLPYDLSSTLGDDDSVPHKKVIDDKATSKGTPYVVVSHKKIFPNKEITSGSVWTNGKWKIVTSAGTSPSGPHYIDSFQTQDEQNSQDGKSTQYGGLPHEGSDPQMSPKLTTTDVECSWHPSTKTGAPTHYYLDRGSTLPYFIKRKNASKETQKPVLKMDDNEELAKDYAHMEISQANDTLHGLRKGPDFADLDALAYDDHSDGEESPPLYKSFVLALVKVKPSRDVQFGCILTAVTIYWTLTAASCIESIEEVDSLDAFVMMEGYGEYDPGRTYAVSDVRVHPMYQGANRSHDLAALRSEERLQRVKVAARLPGLVDYYAITVAERFTILGFGSFRRVAAQAAERGLREAHVYALPTRQCPSGAAEVWALRHLRRGRPVGGDAGVAGGAPLCAGVLYARGTPCVYCAGTPLLRGVALLGLMSRGQPCAVACEPALYVNMAAVRDWIRAVLDPD